MGKEDLKEAAMREKAAAKKKDINDKMASIGLMDSDPNWVPNDDVEQDDVAKSAWYTLKSMIPGTNEYYESAQAEDDLDDLKGIRIEQAKATDLLALAKMGKHEEALHKMRMDTTNDLHYFNRLMQKMEKEGKWEKKPPPVNPFADIEKGKNRLKKAVNKQFAVVDEGALKALAAMSKQQKEPGEPGGQPMHLAEANCTWRAKTRDGEFLQCTNTRVSHPYMMTKNVAGEEVAKVMGFCTYHMKECISMDHKNNKGDAPPALKALNSEAFCAECYMAKLGKKIPPMKPEGAPGVAPVTLQPTGKRTMDDDESVTEEKELTEITCCCWRPSKLESETILRGYICKAVIIRSPETNALINTCGYHVKQCLRIHTEGSGVVSVPNQYGLCPMHFLSEFGHDPKPMPGPYPENHLFPGMETRAAASAWKRRAGHWAAPRWEPEEEVMVREYKDPDKPSWIFSPFERAEKALNWTWYYGVRQWKGNRSAKKVQRGVRRYKHKDTHHLVKAKRGLRARNRATVKIQCCMRKYLGKKHVQAYRELLNGSCTLIEKWWRGYWCRRLFKIDQGAKCIVRLFRYIKQAKMRDSVIAVLQIKKLFIRKMECAVEIQKIMRSWLVRRRVWRARWRDFVNRRSATVIQRHMREFLRLKYLVFWEPPGDDWVREQVAIRLGHLLTNMMMNVRQRRELWEAFQMAAPQMQKLMRGFFARSGVKKLKYLRNKVRKLAPQKWAKDFLRGHMKEHLYYWGEKRDVVEVEVLLEKPVEKPKEGYTRQFLPVDDRKRPDVKREIFIPAAMQWYKSKNIPMLSSEVEALCVTFKNPMDGLVMVNAVDDFISLHTEACRKHGRYICGVCSFQRECTKCACLKYVNPGHAEGVCARCNHPPSFHRTVPLFLKKKSQKNAMRAILQLKREPDTSVPEILKGVASLKFVEDIAIKKIVEEHPSLVEPGGFLYKGNEQRDAMARMAGETPGLAPLLGGDGDCGSDSDCDGDSTAMTVPVKKVKIKDEGPLRLNKFKTSFKKSQESMGKLPLYVQLARLTADGGEVSSGTLHDEYWDQNNMSMINLAKNMAVPVIIQGNPVAPNINLTEPEFWKATEKNPNKTMRDYDEKFEHSLPMPVVSDKHLTFTLEGSKLYLAILVQIATMFEDLTLHYDNPDMVRLVVDHMQIFERHWRKMVQDIRKGTLHVHVSVAPEARELYENTRLPKPEIAEQLDATFKHMGFHQKSMRPAAKDLVLKPYALPKHQKLVDPHKRRLSLSHKVPSVVERVRVFSPDGRAAALRASSSKKPSSPAMVSTRISSSSKPSMAAMTGRAPKRAESPLKGFHKGASAKERLTALGRLMNNGSKEAMLLDEEEMRVQGPSRRREDSRGVKRRGSETDAYRPASLEDQNAIHAQAEASAKDEFKDLMRAGGRYICPFPACGMSFKNQSTSFAHLKTHEQKGKLAAPTPLPDSHMHFYWPRNVPWLSQAQFTEHTVPVGSLPCPVPGCDQSFPSKPRLEAHLKVVHPQQSRLARDQAFFSMGGNHTQCPPFSPGPETPVIYCPNHTLPKGSCVLCCELELLPGPKPPFKFFETATLNFKIRDGGVVDKDGFSAKSVSGGAFDKGPEGSVKLHVDRQEIGVFCRDVNERTGQLEEFRGRVARLCKDGKGDGWVAVRRYYSHAELEARGITNLPRDFDRKTELVFSHESISKWHRLTAVMGQVQIFDMDRQQFKQLVKAGKLPKKNTYFCRPPDEMAEYEDEGEM